MRPRIKEEHCPVRLEDGTVWIGGKIFGLAGRLQDPDGAVWALLELLDGTRTGDQVVAALVPRFPWRSAGEFRADIEQLLEWGYVEDIDEPISHELSERERERYSRGRSLNRWVTSGRGRSSWDFQVRLSRARIAVVGVGGVGCTAALDLAMSGVGYLHCVEPDVVELSNLNRQLLYNERDLGRAKIEAAVEKLRAVNSDIEVTGELLRVESPITLQSLASDCDVLVLGADQPEDLRSWTNRACTLTATPWAFGSYHGPLVTTGMYRPGLGACYDCISAAGRRREAELRPVAVCRAVVKARRAHAANAVTAGVAGNLVAHLAMSLLTGAPRLRANCHYAFNLLTLDQAFVTAVQPDPACRLCGTDASDPPLPLTS